MLWALTARNHESVVATGGWIAKGGGGALPHPANPTPTATVAATAATHRKGPAVRIGLSLA